MKKILFLVFAFVLLCTGCNKQQIPLVPYDFEALRDSLNLDSTCIFIEECSPYYTDDNPYKLNPSNRIKTLFYRINRPGIEYDTLYWGNIGLDTVLYAVHKDNHITFEGCNSRGANIKKLVTWIIANRDKL